MPNIGSCKYAKFEGDGDCVIRKKFMILLPAHRFHGFFLVEIREYLIRPPHFSSNIRYIPHADVGPEKSEMS